MRRLHQAYRLHRLLESRCCRRRSPVLRRILQGRTGLPLVVVVALPGHHGGQQQQRRLAPVAEYPQPRRDHLSAFA